jgi:hypothetical protein
MYFRQLTSVSITLLSLHLTPAQTPGKPPPSTVVTETNRQEMDSLLMRKPIPANEDRSSKQARLKQINEDFKELQRLNNKLRSAVSTNTELDYHSVVDLISQMESKAKRLRSNLTLPRLESKKEPVVLTDFVSGLKALDLAVVSFTKNALFQQVNVVELDLANKASQDLASIIELSSKLKRTANKK